MIYTSIHNAPDLCKPASHMGLSSGRESSCERLLLGATWGTVSAEPSAPFGAMHLLAGATC